MTPEHRAAHRKLITEALVLIDNARLDCDHGNWQSEKEQLRTAIEKLLKALGEATEFAWKSTRAASHQAMEAVE